MSDTPLLDTVALMRLVALTLFSQDITLAQKNAGGEGQEWSPNLSFAFTRSDARIGFAFKA
jgi:hypothetical protein